MRYLTTLILFSIVLNSFSQDLIVTKNKKIINAKILIISNDTIKYSMPDNITNKQFVILRDSIIGIEYKDGARYETKNDGISLNRALITYKRINKKGFYIGAIILGGAVKDAYFTPINIADSCFANNTEDDNGYSIELCETNTYFFNNIIGIKFGIGYSYIEHNSYLNIYKKPNNYKPDYKYSYNLPVYSKLEHNDFINSVMIPVRAVVTPGNIFGVYADIGLTVYIPYIAKYAQTEIIEATGEKYIDRVNFISEINKVNVVYSGTIGLHYQLNKDLFIYSGVNVNLSFGAYQYSIGGVLGVSYRISSILH